MAYCKPTLWSQIVNDLARYNDLNSTDVSLTEKDLESEIKFMAGTPSTEMLRVGKDGFYVRGVKVTQDDKEAETVYNAFKAWMVWAELNRK